MTRYFEDFEIGESYESPGRTITEADQLNYAGLSGNFHPLHLDAEAAKDTPFDGRLVYGGAILAIMEGLRAQADIDYQDATVAYYGMDGVRFVAPVLIGDTIHNEIEVSALEEREDGTGLMSTEEKAVNQDGEVVVVATTKRVMERRD